MTISDEQLERMRRLALRLAGIELLERHRELLGRRCGRRGISDAAGLNALLSAAEGGDGRVAQQLVDLLTTKFTGFFRHPRHFDVAAKHALDPIRRNGRARIWSAAAATGEEPYSLAMAMVEAFGADNPPVTILATDIDEQALDAARRGEYGEVAMRSLTIARRDRFFAESGPRRWVAGPALRRLVEFRPLNLVAATWPVEGPFDVVFCRNVLMYLEARHRCAVLERIASLLAPAGLLFLDPTEHTGGAGHLFTPATGGVHVLRT